MISSAVGEWGERAENERFVRGNMVGLGFPARKEMRPGVFSSGRSPRTKQRQQSEGRRRHRYSGR